MMIVEDLGGLHPANSDAEMERALAARYGQGVNEIWLAHGDQLFPALSILANKDLACVHFYPEEFDPGFQSVGPVPGLDPDQKTAFFVNTPTEILSMSNRSVVPFSLALEAAREFSKSPTLPRCIKWFRL
jgi:hypothetical protein